MQVIDNPYRGCGLPAHSGLAQGRVAADPAAPLALLARCPAARPTPLRSMTGTAGELGVGALWLKDESRRMGLGSFKALGAAYVIAQEAARRSDRCDAPATFEDMRDCLEDRVYVCASAGNHGLSLAAGARLFGAAAVVYLSGAVPESFAERLRGIGARVVRAGGDYEESMKAAAEDAAANGWMLLSDSSWPGYTELPARIMEGYLVIGAEIAEVLQRAPTHVMLQAGVGGMAAAMAAFVRARWGDGPLIVVVEPQSAAALTESIRAGGPVTARGPASIMGRLDCKTPSHLALGELARSADLFATISDDECERTVTLLGRHGIDTSPSGAAGVAALEHGGVHRARLRIDAGSRVLAIVSEGGGASV